MWSISSAKHAGGRVSNAYGFRHDMWHLGAVIDALTKAAIFAVLSI